jgi:DNA-binding response OmpR family regulator
MRNENRRDTDIQSIVHNTWPMVICVGLNEQLTAAITTMLAPNNVLVLHASTLPRGVIKNFEPTPATLLRSSELVVDMMALEARWAGKVAVCLTPQEMRILTSLLKTPGPKTFAELQIPGQTGFGGTGALRSAVSRLRLKFRRAGIPATIRTVPRIGLEIVFWES